MKKKYWQFCAYVACGFVWLYAIAVVALISAIVWKESHALAVLTVILLTEVTTRNAWKFTKAIWPKKSSPPIELINEG